MISGEQATYVEQSVLLTVGMGFTQDGGHRGEPEPGRSGRTALPWMRPGAMSLSAVLLGG